ncbi:two-component system, NarL family, nitrate/nitrite response regulator NarL [Rhizobiales bacterium GAS188]|nr:two-component system, NarL family, nitrate/nitrite response regulator NarL [Rhizobiales bacterium GAS188]
MRILGSAGLDVVAAAASVAEIALSTHNQSILLILHVSNDDNATIAQIHLFRAQYPTARIVLLIDHGPLKNGAIIAAFRAGVDAYFVKPTHDSLIKCLELVMLGATIMSPAVLSSMLYHPNEVIASDGRKNKESEVETKYTHRLSKRQESILRCLVEGDSNKIIAAKRNIAEATVKVHVKAILRELGVGNRTQAAMWAMRNEALMGSMLEGEPPRAAIEAEQRRLADRQGASTAKTTELGELRRARDAVERGGAAPGAERKPVGPFPTDRPDVESDK